MCALRRNQVNQEVGLIGSSGYVGKIHVVPSKIDVSKKAHYSSKAPQFDTESAF